MPGSRKLRIEAMRECIQLVFRVARDVSRRSAMCCRPDLALFVFKVPGESVRFSVYKLD